MGRYWKAIVATLALVATWAAAALSDGHVTPAEWCALVPVLAGAFGVYQVRNAPMPPAEPVGYAGPPAELPTAP